MIPSSWADRPPAGSHRAMGFEDEQPFARQQTLGTKAREKGEGVTFGVVSLGTRGRWLEPERLERLRTLGRGACTLSNRETTEGADH